LPEHRRSWLVRPRYRPRCCWPSSRRKRLPTPRGRHSRRQNRPRF